jgi:hypothetical protein
VQRSKYFMERATHLAIRNGSRFATTCGGLIELMTRAADLSNFE